MSQTPVSPARNEEGELVGTEGVGQGRRQERRADPSSGLRDQDDPEPESRCGQAEGGGGREASEGAGDEAAESVAGDPGDPADQTRRGPLPEIAPRRRPRRSAEDEGRPDEGGGREEGGEPARGDEAPAASRPDEPGDEAGEDDQPRRSEGLRSVPAEDPAARPAEGQENGRVLSARGKLAQLHADREDGGCGKSKKEEGEVRLAEATLDSLRGPEGRPLLADEAEVPGGWRSTR